MNNRDKLMKFGAYTKALELFDFVVADMALMAGRRECDRLVAQQMASADSIAANIGEGYGRGTRKEYCQVLVIARGSAQETAGRDGRLRHWLPWDAVTRRVTLCDEIIGILTASSRSLRQPAAPAR